MDEEGREGRGGQAGAEYTGRPSPATATRHWIDALVLGLGLCPFAGPALARDLVRIVVLETDDVAVALQGLADAAEALLDPDEAPDATTLLVLPGGFADFEDYLDLLALAEALLEDLGHEGALQIASFHPDYRFDGEPADDPANWSNRAPHPTLQLLREDSLTRALDAHPDPDGIPGRNIETLRALGRSGIAARLERNAERGLDDDSGAQPSA